MPGKLVSRWAALIASMLWSACAASGEPKPYAPPPQVVMPSGPEPAVATASGEQLLVTMSDSHASAHILGDVFTAIEGAEFRFTGLHPQFLLQVDDPAGLDF